MIMKCRLCSKIIESPKLYGFKNMPDSAQGLLDMVDENDKGISYDLYQCEYCGMIQLDCEPVSYFKDVIRTTGNTKTMNTTRFDEISYFARKYNLIDLKVLEIGSGQGENLRIGKSLGLKIYGLENNKTNVDKSISFGYHTINGYPDDSLLIEESPFDAFMCFNFLEHQPDPNLFIQGISRQLKKGAVGFVTVPDFDFIIRSNGYYEFIRDHLLYFNKDTLITLFKNNGFEILELGDSNKDTIKIIVKKRSGFVFDDIIEKKDYLKGQIKAFFKCHKNVAVWGASHQAFTIIQMLQISDKISFIIDSAPFKQGKYSPASHIKIVSSEEIDKSKIDGVIIIAPTYSDEIANIIKDNYPNVDVVSILNNHLIKY